MSTQDKLKFAFSQLFFWKKIILPKVILYLDHSPNYDILEQLTNLFNPNELIWNKVIKSIGLTYPKLAKRGDMYNEEYIKSKESNPKSKEKKYAPCNIFLTFKTLFTGNDNATPVLIHWFESVLNAYIAFRHAIVEKNKKSKFGLSQLHFTKNLKNWILQKKLKNLHRYWRMSILSQRTYSMVLFR